MTHPAYPSRADLRAEAVADRMVALQEGSVIKFRAARDAFAAAISMLDFPLGCPVAGYDWVEIEVILKEWSRIEAPNEVLAMDLAREEA